jgi:hypothetical protein
MDKLVSLFRDYPNQISALVALCALLASLLVSLLSIRFTVHALRLQREHNFKTLTPIASIITGNYEDNIEVKVRNTGVGPLIVEEFRSRAASDLTQAKADLISWMPNNNEILYTTFTYSIDGRCIPPNAELILIQLQGDPDDKQFAAFRDKVRTILSGLLVTLKYKDLYDRQMPTQERHLARFGKNFAALDLKATKRT